MAEGDCTFFVIVDAGGDPVTVFCSRRGRHRLHKIEHEWVDNGDVVAESIFPD